MTEAGVVADVSDGIALLERAVGYTLGSLHLVAGTPLTAPTPCADWDLGELLAHMDDSLEALEEAVEGGAIGLTPTRGGLASGHRDPVEALKARACRMLGSWTSGQVREASSIGGCWVPTSLVIGTGAVEVAVHGWDVAQACAAGRPLPEALASELLPYAYDLVSPLDRPVRFGPAVVAESGQSAAQSLLRYVGRDPNRAR